MPGRPSADSSSSPTTARCFWTRSAAWGRTCRASCTASRPGCRYRWMTSKGLVPRPELLPEAPETSGLSGFLSSMWLRGTRGRSAADFARATESLAAEIDGFSGRNSLGLTLETPSGRLEPALELFAEVLLEPAFDRDEIERERRDTLAAIERREDRLAQRAFLLFAETHYRHHPYRQPVLGTAKSVRGFDREQLIAHHGRLIKARNLALAVAGDVDPDDAVIVMEYVDGVNVRDAVDRLTDEERRILFIRIGGYAGMLHGAGIIHGDLTTSNILKQGDRLVFIDFGLAEVSTEVEKRGVDLNLMDRMLTSTHYRHHEELLAAFLEGYRGTMGAEAEEAVTRMEEVARRGRYIEKN